MSETDDDENGAARVTAWFCPVCATLATLAEAERGECCQEPPRDDCPLECPV